MTFTLQLEHGLKLPLTRPEATVFAPIIADAILVGFFMLGEQILLPQPKPESEVL
jgi:hypothetical protein